MKYEEKEFQTILDKKNLPQHYKEICIFKSKHCKIYEIYYKSHRFILKKVKKRRLHLSNHAYVISFICINKLMKKHSISNFHSCLFYSIENSNQYLFFNFCTGITFHEYIKKHINQVSNHILVNSFLSMFFQIVCALEISQERFLFCHFDLHLRNILISKLDDKITEDFSYYGIIQKRRVKAYSYQATVIDYEFAFSKDLHKILLNQRFKKRFQYGYINAFSPSIDILRLLFCILKITFACKEKHTFGNQLKLFCLYLLEDFYNIKISKIKDVPSLLIHEQIYFCMLSHNSIYKTMTSLLLYLNKKLNYIQRNIFESNIHHHDIIFETEDYTLQEFRKNLKGFGLYTKSSLNKIDFFENLNINNIMKYIPVFSSTIDCISLFLRKMSDIPKAYMNSLMKASKSIEKLQSFFENDENLKIHSFYYIYLSLQTIETFLIKTNLNSLEINQKIKEISYLK